MIGWTMSDLPFPLEILTSLQRPATRGRADGEWVVVPETTFRDETKQNECCFTLYCTLSRQTSPRLVLHNGVLQINNRRCVVRRCGWPDLG